MDDVIASATVLFSSPCMGKNVEKHFRNLQQHMLKKGTFDMDKQIAEEDYKVMLKILVISLLCLFLFNDEFADSTFIVYDNSGHAKKNKYWILK